MTGHIRPMLACGLPGDTQAEKLAALEGLPYPLLASYKLDGIRCLIAEAGPQTRSGEPIPNDHVRALLSTLPVGLDGELVCLGADGAADFRLTTGNIRRRAGTPEFVYYVFDLFNAGGAFEGRTEGLRRMRHGLPSWTVLCGQWEVTSAEGVRNLFASALEAGHEGLILRDGFADYKHGRATAKSAAMLKVKPYEDSEAVIVSVFERMANTAEATKDKLGHTKRSNLKTQKASTGMLGGFVVIDAVNHTQLGWMDDEERKVFLKKFAWEVGRGKMTHEEAAHLWFFREALPGKVIRFQHVTVGGYDVPRHGTFQGFREKWDMGG